MRVRLRGWAWLDRKDLSIHEERHLRKLLTVRPRSTHPQAETPPPIRLFRRTEFEFGIPRAFFLRYQSNPTNELVWETTKGSSSWPGDLTFDGTLRDNQQPVHDKVVPKLREGSTGGLIIAPTGAGKTVMACDILAAINRPMLVLVHRELLADQWEESFRKFLPGCEYSRIQGTELAEWDYEGKHVCVAMIQSLSQARLPPEFLGWPGILCVDECHRIGAQTWSQIPHQFPAHIRLGLTATPDRKDDAEDVFWHHIGPTLARVHQANLAPSAKRVWTGFDPHMVGGRPAEYASEAALLKTMTYNARRNRLIIRKLVEALDAGRRVLVVSKRLKHLELLEEIYTKEWLDLTTTDSGDMPTWGHCVGGISKEERDEIKENAQVIFATSQYVKEGFDVASLDTLFLTQPMADVRQVVGRILRVHDDKKDPIVVDFRDDEVELFRKWGAWRERQYREMAR